MIPPNAMLTEGGPWNRGAGLRLSDLALTIFYLTGPLLIISELVLPEISIPILVLFALWAFPLAFPRSAAATGREQAFNPLRLTASLAALALCFVWIYLSGIGSHAICRWDYVKHNLLFSYLLEQKLPIEVDFEGRNFIVHYNLAYYITPVRAKEALENLFNKADLNLILLLTYSTAVFFALRILAGRIAALSLVLFLVLSLVGGWDVLGMIAFKVKPAIAASIPIFDIGIPGNLEWWGIPYAPQSLTMNLYWAPQHFFAALIGTALVFAFMQSCRPAAVVLVDVLTVIAASVFWSPYAAVGLLVLACLKFGIDDHAALPRRLFHEGAAPLLTGRSLPACAFAAALTLAAWVFLTAAVPLSPPRLLVNQANVLPWLLTYTLNYAPLILVLILVLWPHARRPDPTCAIEEDASSRPLLLMITACLAASAALLLVVHGTFNDWAIRAPLPLSIALAVAVTQVLFAKLKRIYLAVLLGVLALSSASSLSEIAQATLIAPVCAPYGSFSLKDMGPLASQYAGRPDSLLYRYLVRSR